MPSTIVSEETGERITLFNMLTDLNYEGMQFPAGAMLSVQGPQPHPCFLREKGKNFKDLGT